VLVDLGGDRPAVSPNDLEDRLVAADVKGPRLRDGPRYESEAPGRRLPQEHERRESDEQSAGVSVNPPP
jgi:hypothetical protein